MPDWYVAISDEIQSALQLRGLGRTQADTARLLRAQYPDLSFREATALARQAGLAISAAEEVQHETLRGGTGPCQSISFLGIPSGVMYVDAEITFTDPHTGRQNRRFMRATLPVGSSYAEVQGEAESFVGWLDNRYGLPVNPNQVDIRYIAVMCGA